MKIISPANYMWDIISHTKEGDYFTGVIHIRFISAVYYQIYIRG